LRELTSRTEAELKMETRVPDWAMRKFLTTNLERTADGDWRWAINLPGITEALSGLEDDPLAEEESFTGPSLFVLGGKSRYVREDDYVKIRQHFPAVEIQVIADSGHNPHMQSRDAFAAVISDWVGSLG
ncbi:alpha/beta hydrolase, partial [Opitutaceae bacterium]|nr:alpha/beta hydrolase [Opitutaceae bacterium]